MSFDWSSYFTVAELPKQSADSETDVPLKEAHCRTAISRAYYFAFNIAFPRFLFFWQSVPKQDRGNKHQFLINRFTNYQSQTDASKQTAYNNIGEKLDRLREYRNNADYDDVLGERPDRRTRAALKLSQQIATLLDENQ